METQLSRAEKLDRLFGTPVFAVIIAILCNAMWGSAFPFIKLGYRLFAIDTADTASILCFAGVRFMLGSVLVLGGSLLLEGRLPAMPKGKILAECCALGLWQTHSAVCLFLQRCCPAHRCLWGHPEQHPEPSGGHLRPLPLRQG